MSDYLSLAHNGVTQIIRSGGWHRVACDGVELFVPPFDGRGVVGVQLFGHASSHLLASSTQWTELRLVRRPADAGPDQTGIDSRGLRPRRRFGWVYAWTGHLSPDHPLTLELSVAHAAIALENVAIKIDRLGAVS